jgi:membrane associated rhomboid family serine protease
MPDYVYGTSQQPWVTIAIIAVTVISSMVGFKDPAYLQRFIFSPEKILRDKQGYRLISAAFLHADWQHLVFNMYTFYVFGRVIELNIGVGTLLAIYFASIIGGNLLSLFIHRHHVYLAYGASGGVSGVIFAFILFFPHNNISFLFIPVAIPPWLYAIGYLLYSFHGLKRGTDNIGHDAHIGGAIIGLLTATVLYPHIVAESPVLYAAVMVVSLGIFIYLMKNPFFLPLRSFTPPQPSPRRRSRPSSDNPAPPDVNAVLDKISKSGMNSLTEAEHKALLNASRNERRNDSPK